MISSTHRRHRATEFKTFLAKIDTQVPDDLDVHVICDNYGTHKHPVVNKWLEEHPRSTMHFIPTYSSWRNQVERLRLRNSRSPSALRLTAASEHPRKTSRVGEGMERIPQAIRVDQDRGPDPRITRTTSAAVHRRRTLGAPVK